MENQDLSYGDACGLATRSSMRADNKVLVYGLGVDDPKGMYGTTKGLVEEFERIDALTHHCLKTA